MPGKATPIEETSAGGVVFRRTPENGTLYLLIRDSYRNWGFPKGHLEPGEERADAARREVAEETGLEDLAIRGPVQEIDWFFRFRGRLIHKTCAFYLMESAAGDASPQRDEGITACRWLSLEEAMRSVSYANAREVLRAAGQLVAQLTVP
jgi:8-oxo-dGTP pyrophosphatase MutT (NUDIX family)